MIIQISSNAKISNLKTKTIEKGFYYFFHVKMKSILFIQK